MQASALVNVSAGALECKPYFLPAFSMDGEEIVLPLISFSSDDPRSRNQYKQPHEIKSEFRAKLQSRASICACSTTSLSSGDSMNHSMDADKDIMDGTKLSRIPALLRSFRNLARCGFNPFAIGKSRRVKTESSS
jgi:hypothetical protein